MILPAGLPPALQPRQPRSSALSAGDDGWRRTNLRAGGARQRDAGAARAQARTVMSKKTWGEKEGGRRRERNARGAAAGAARARVARPLSRAWRRNGPRPSEALPSSSLSGRRRWWRPRMRCAKHALSPTDARPTDAGRCTKTRSRRRNTARRGCRTRTHRRAGATARRAAGSAADSRRELSEVALMTAADILRRRVRERSQECWRRACRTKTSRRRVRAGRSHVSSGCAQQRAPTRVSSTRPPAVYLFSLSRRRTRRPRVCECLAHHASIRFARRAARPPPHRSRELTLHGQAQQRRDASGCSGGDHRRRDIAHGADGARFRAPRLLAQASVRASAPKRLGRARRQLMPRRSTRQVVTGCGVASALGLVVGGVALLAARVRGDFSLLPRLAFDPAAFFTYLLPPLIFNAGACPRIGYRSQPACASC